MDIDEEGWVEYLEAEFPVFKDTATCKTGKGKHYYFVRTPECDAIQLFDSVRKMKVKGDDGMWKALPIDIKTVARTGTRTAIAIPPSRNKQWVRQLGFDGDPLPMPSEFLDFFKTHVVEASRPTTNGPPSNNTGDHDSSEVAELVNLLDAHRADTYEDWMRVGWCLHNIDPLHNLGLWVQFSKRSSKYKSGECERLWDTMANEGLGVGSLHMWAKQDNPYEYKSLVNSRVYTDIKTCNGSHNAVAHIGPDQNEPLIIHLRHDTRCTWGDRGHSTSAYRRAPRIRTVDNVQTETPLSCPL